MKNQQRQQDTPRLTLRKIILGRSTVFHQHETNRYMRLIYGTCEACCVFKQRFETTRHHTPYMQTRCFGHACCGEHLFNGGSSGDIL